MDVSENDVFVLIKCYESDDKYYPPYQMISGVYKTLEDASIAIEKLHQEIRPKYDDEVYYELCHSNFVVNDKNSYNMFIFLLLLHLILHLVISFYIQCLQ